MLTLFLSPSGLVLPQKAPIAAPYRSTLRSGEGLEVVHTEYDVTPSDRDLCPETEVGILDHLTDITTQYYVRL